MSIRTVVRGSFALVGIVIVFGFARAADENGTLVIRVTDENKMSIERATARVTNCKDPKPCPDGTDTCSSGNCEGGVKGECCTDQQSATNSNGTVTFKLPAGSYTVTITREEFAKETISDVVVREGETTTRDVTLRKRPEANAKPYTSEPLARAMSDATEKITVEGTVRDKNKKRVANVMVRVTRPSCSACPDGTATCSSGNCVGGVKGDCCPDQFAITDERGKYVIANISADAGVDVTYIKDGNKQGRLAVALDPGDRKVTLNVQLTQQIKSVPPE
jgi:hypothetical protein